MINFLKTMKEDTSCAIVFDNKTASYKEIYTKYIQKKELLIKSNITNKSIVCIQGEINLETISLMLAIIDLKAIYVPIDLSIDNVEKYIKISQASHFIKAPYNEIYQTKQTASHEKLKKLSNSNSSGLILFSSGTTGEPKASLHNLDPFVEKFLQQGKTFTSIAFLLFDHIGGFNTLMYSLFNKGTLILPQNRNVDTICSLIEKYKVEVLPTTPSFLNMLLLSKAYDFYDLSSLKVITYGTEPMPEQTLININKVLEVSLKQTYGLSELGILRTKSLDSNSLFMKLGDDTHEIKIIDDILFIKSKMSMLCYLNAPSPFDKDGFFNTQDKVEIENGYIKILGRVSDIINVGGEKVYPNEVESVILEVKGVVDVIVKGEQNLILGNIVVAKVNINKDYNEKDILNNIKNLCKEKLDKYKRPLKIIISQECFLSQRLKKQR